MEKVVFPNTQFDLVVVASSAGGLYTLTTLLHSLPVDFPAALLIVQHLQPSRPSLFPGLLGKSSSLTVLQAEDGLKLHPGAVYVSPAGAHLLVKSDLSLAITHTAAIDFHRPSADVLFESAAAACGPRVIAVVLSGMQSDGSRGAEAIHAAGGRVIAQSPASSKYSSMPQAAINTGIVDFVLPLDQIAPKIISLVYGG